MSYFIGSGDTNTEASRTSAAPVSTVYTENNNTNDLEIVGVASDFVDAMREVIKETVLANAPRIHTAQVIEQVDDNHYNVRVVTASAEDTVVSNIINQCRYDLQKGDYVQLLDSNNNINTAYIIGKQYVPFTKDLTTVSYTNRDYSISGKYCALRYSGKRWWLTIGKELYVQLEPFFTELPVYSGEGLNRTVVATKNGVNLTVGILRENTDGVWERPANGYIQVNKDIDESSALFDYIATEWVYELDKLTCEALPVPAIDITGIVDNSIFMDNTCKKYDYDDNVEGWSKNFALYILLPNHTALYCDLENPPSEITGGNYQPKGAYNVTVDSDHSCRWYNINNLEWLGGQNINLQGESTSSYQPESKYVTRTYTYGNLEVPASAGSTTYNTFITGSPEGLVFQALVPED